MEKIKLVLVKFLPKELEPWVLYVSEEFSVAGHLCPCGCGNKIITPLGLTEWSFTEYNGKPTLYPSLGNWQLPCRSHYWITEGVIGWSYQWTDDQIIEGYRSEEMKRKIHFERLSKKQKRKTILSRISDWSRGFFLRKGRG